jgi:molecular chaperone DnaJ
LAKDYYAILSVSRTCTDDELKSAFRKLALQYHPDRNPGDKEAEDKFKEVNEAYECLRDPQKRAYFDRYGSLDGYGATSGFGFSGGFGDVFNDVFSEFFGASSKRRRPRPTRGDDLRYDLEITLEDAFYGLNKDLEIPRWDSCETCDGSGVKPGSSESTTCPDCKGSGEIYLRQAFLTLSKTCGRCHGSGRFIKDPCGQCNGLGKAKKTHSVSVKIPPGIDNGIRLKVTGAGEAGSYGGPYGDLYVVISVIPHSFFERKEDDLFCMIPISFTQAALGAEVKVATIDKKDVTIKIPEGSQPGRVFEMRGMGMPRLQRYGRGDMLVQIAVTIPTTLTQRQRELLKEFAKISGEEAPESMFDKVINIFSPSKD